MSSVGAASRAAVTVSSARAEASRRNGAKSRGPKTLEGRARAAQNALKHGMRAQKYVVPPEEDAAEFAGLEAALIAELAPVGALPHRPQPDEPERNPEPQLEYVSTEPPARVRALHEPAAPWLPNEPEAGLARMWRRPDSAGTPSRSRTRPDPKGAQAARALGSPEIERTRSGREARRDASSRALAARHPADALVCR